MAIGESFTRGTLTTSHASLARPTSSNSSWEPSNSIALRCISWACGSVTRLVTNSPLSRMLTNVSFSVPSDRGCRVRDTIGGTRLTTVKNEIGARLATPDDDRVLTQPIARGVTAPMSSLYADLASSSSLLMITLTASLASTAAYRR